MNSERHFGFEIENKITKHTHPDAMISPTLENVPFDRERDVYLLDSIVLTSGQSPLICKNIYILGHI